MLGSHAAWRRWIEVVGALVFSKIAMAVVFALGISATGNADPSGETSIGTFLAGILVLAVAALAPFATFTFIHWAGDHGQSASHAIQQGLTGAHAVKDQYSQAQQWRADHFGGTGDDTSGPAVGGDPQDPADNWSEHDGDRQHSSGDAGVSGDSSRPTAENGDGDVSSVEPAVVVATPDLSGGFISAR